MPFIGGGNISAPGTPYDGQPIQTTLINLSRAAQGGNPQAVSDLKMISGLPQFQGFGWQGLLAMGLSIAGGSALAGSLGAAGAGGGLGGTVGGTTGTLGTINSVLNNPLAQLGISALGGALNNTAGARTQTQAPTIAPEFQGLAGLLRQRAMERLMSPVDTSGLAANAIAGINDAYRGITQRNNANLTARGLATSPVAANVDTQTNLARAGDITQFLNNLPQLQRELSNSDIAAAGDVLRFGTGSTTQLPGSALGGAISSAAGMLGYQNMLKILQGGGSNPNPYILY